MNLSRPKEEENQLRRCWRPSAILSDDVGNKGVLQNGDFVAQKQFPFFQTGKPQLIPTARIDQRHDRRIQIPVILAQDFMKAHEEIGRSHVCTQVYNAYLVCRLLLATTNQQKTRLQNTTC